MKLSVNENLAKKRSKRSNSQSVEEAVSVKKTAVSGVFEIDDYRAVISPSDSSQIELFRRNKSTNFECMVTLDKNWNFTFSHSSASEINKNDMRDNMNYLIGLRATAEKVAGKFDQYHEELSK